LDTFGVADALGLKACSAGAAGKSFSRNLEGSWNWSRPRTRGGRSVGAPECWTARAHPWWTRVGRILSKGAIRSYGRGTR